MTPLQQDRIPAVEDEPRHQKVRRSRPCAKSTHWISETIREGLLVPDPDLRPVCAPFLWRHIHGHPEGYPSR